MSAQEHLSGLQFEHMPEGTVHNDGRSVVEPGGLGVRALLQGHEIGHLRWHHPSGEIDSVEVEGRHQRKGVATAMWHLAHQEGHELYHSPHLSEEGEGWSYKVGGPRAESFEACQNPNCEVC